MTKPNDTYSFRLDVIAFMIIAVSFVVRYWFVASGQLNLVQDEAQYWDWIRRPQLSYYSKGPLIAWVISFWCKVFGSTELGVRFGSIIGMTGIQAALYIGISRVWREYRLALYALFVSATMILLNGLGILATTDNPLLLCWTVAFFALSAATRNKPDYTPGNLPFVILGICVAIGILGKYMMLAFVGLGVIYAAILHLRGQLPARFWRRFALASLVGTVVGMLPIILWNMQNDWVGFKHVAGQAAGKPKPFEIRIGPFFEMLGAQIGLMAPWWAVAIAVATWRAIKKDIVGPIGSFDCKYRHTLQALLFFLPLWAVITFWSLKSRTEANWTAAAFIGAAILGGMGLKTWWENPRRKLRGKAILTSVAVGLTLFIYVTPVLPLPAEYNITNRLKGWDDLGQQIETLKLSAFEDPDNVFVISDKYDITAELAFYTPGQPLAFCAWIDDRRMNQYDIWPAPKIGQDAVFVREWMRNKTHPLILKMFDEVGEPVKIYSKSNGQPMREFTLYPCKGFNGFWPRNNSDRF